MRSGERPLLILDLGSPSQVRSEVRNLPGVHLLQLDDLLMGARPPLGPDTREQVERVVEDATEFYRR